MLNVLESKDGVNHDNGIASAARDGVALAVKDKLLEKKGTRLSNWFVHYTSFGLEFKATVAKSIAIYSAIHVADNILLVVVLDSDTMRDAKVLAATKGFDSIDGWSFGQFVFLVGAPSILGEIETEMEMAIDVVCKGFVGLLDDGFNEQWRQHGDKILLPSENGTIKTCETAPDYFSDIKKGTTRKTGVVLNLLVVFQSPIIAFFRSNDDIICNFDAKQLAVAILRCSTSDIFAKTGQLKKGDLFFSQNAKAKKFLENNLRLLLQKSKDRTGVFLKYCLFLDLRRDIKQQLQLLLKVLHRSHLESDLLQSLFGQTSGET